MTRRWVAAVVVLAACDGGAATPDAAPIDAPAPDASDDPYAGKFDSSDDFPRTGCAPGSLAGFARAEYWPTLSLRTALEPDLVTYQPRDEGDRAVPHTLTADDLLTRRVAAFGTHWELEAIDACAVDADGTLRGAVAHCFEISLPCDVRPFTARPLHRIVGEAEGDHLALVGELGGAPTWPGRTLDLDVVGDLAYLARGSDGVRVVDLSDPAHPRERGHFAAADDDWNDVEVLTVGGRRYAIGASNVTRVVDVTDPDAPALVAEVPRYAHTVFLDGTTAYLAPDGAPVTIVDLADPRAPRQLGTITDHQVHDAFVADGVAYLSAPFEGLVAVDVHDPAAPTVIATAASPGRYWHRPWLTSVGGRRLILSGDEGAPTVLRILDGAVGAPAFLATVGEWPSPRELVSIHNFQAVGARAYVAHYEDGIRVLDLTDPTHPTQVAYFNTWREHTGPAGWKGAYGIDVDVARRRLYVADSIRGLLILQGDATVFP